MIIIRLK